MGRKKGSKKETYPKGMSIRYSKEQEQEIFEMQQKMGENTMSKAFLKCPQVIREQHKKIEHLNSLVQEQQQTIRQLRDIVNSWQIFSKKLEAFVEGKYEVMQNVNLEEGGMMANEKKDKH